MVADNAPLIVEDARVHPVLHDNGSIKDYNLIGYLGFPLQIASGKTLGSFCVVDNQPRRWSTEDIETMRELADVVKYEIEARAMTRKGDMTVKQLDAIHTEIETFADRIDVGQSKAEILGQIRAEQKVLFENITAF